MANSTTVYIITLNGQPMGSVYTSLVKACEVVGVSYGKVRFNVEESGAWVGAINGAGVMIQRAEIVKQSKGRKNPFPNK